MSTLDFTRAFPFALTLTLLTRTVTGRDADGNDIYGSTSTEISHVPAWPTGGSELVQGQDTVISHMSCLLPPLADPDLSAVDAVEVNGSTYEVDGPPQPFTSPFTGLAIGAQLNLTRVEG